jgi:3-methyl-2-oxobutanoate hydroxymethyltransferase
MGHLGLTPQSVHVTGGFKVQAKDIAGIESLMDDARALETAGCFAIVLECVPGPVAKLVTESIAVPTIGIGSGPDCDGQVLVFHDVTGLGDPNMHEPRYLRRYASLGEQATEAVRSYADDVRNRRFPGAEETYSLPKRTSASLTARGGDRQALDVTQI